MTRTLWRISDYADLSDIGGMYASARWHTIGRPIIYTAESGLGALAEFLVHADVEFIGDDFQLLKIETNKDVSVKQVDGLPSNWTSQVPLTQSIGHTWLASNETALLRVPSAILQTDYNILINPSHPDTAKIRIATSERLPLDPRLRK